MPDQRIAPPGDKDEVSAAAEASTIPQWTGEKAQLESTETFADGTAAQAAEERFKQRLDRALQGERYQKLESIGRGGQGEVYAALDHELGRHVAVKELRDATGDAGHQARFLREAEIISCLDHPGIVPIYSLGRSADGRPYYAMRLIKGTTLSEAIAAFRQNAGNTGPRQFEHLDLRRLLARFVAACETVAYAHARGIVHRDLKPQNIMLGEFGEVLVVDWGLARHVRDDRVHPELEPLPSSDESTTSTMAGTIIGSLGYMSPEQASGDQRQVGTASDVYSLGATLYHLLTGEPPHRHLDAADPERKAKLLKAIGRGDFPRPGSRNKHIPARLQAICLKAMAHSPADRYASALELAHDIENWLADNRVAAYRENRWERLSRWSRRHRQWVLSGLAATLLTSLVLVAALAYSQVQRSRAVALADEKTRLAQEVAGKSAENLHLANNNAVLAVEQTRLREASDLRSLDAQFSQGVTAFESANGELALLILADALQRIEALEQTATEAKDLPARLQPSADYIAQLDARASTLERYLAAQQRSVPLLEGVVECEMGVDGCRFDSHNEKLLVRDIIGRQSVTHELKLASGEIETIHVPDARGGFLPRPFSHGFNQPIASANGQHALVLESLSRVNVYRFEETSDKLRQTIELGRDDIKGLMALELDGRSFLGQTTDGRLLHISLPEAKILGDRPALDVAVISAAIAEGGKYIALGLKNGAVVLADGSLKQLRWSHPHTKGVASVAISFDAAHIASSSSLGVDVWTVAKRRNQFAENQGTQTSLVQFVPGRSVAAIHGVGTFGGQTVSLLNAATGKFLPCSLAVDGSIEGVTFDPAGQRLAVVSRPEGTRLPTNLSTFKTVNPATGAKPSVWCWRLPEVGREALPANYWYGANAPRASFDRTGRRLAIIRGEEMRVTDIVGGTEVAVSPVPKAVRPEFTPDGNSVFIADAATGVQRWDATTAALLQQAKFEPLSALKMGGMSALSPKVDWFAFRTDQRDMGSFSILDLTTGHVKQLPLTVPTDLQQLGAGYVVGHLPLAFSSDGTLLATAEQTGDVQIWNVGPLMQPHRKLKGDRGGITAMRFSPSNDFLFTVSLEGVLQAWNARTGQKLGRFQVQQMLFPGLFNASGSQIVGIDPHARLCAWDTTSGKVVGVPIILQQSADIIRVLDDRYVATFSTRPQTMQRWDLAHGKAVGAPEALLPIAASADGKLCAVDARGAVSVECRMPSSHSGVALKTWAEVVTGRTLTARGAPSPCRRRSCTSAGSRSLHWVSARGSIGEKLTRSWRHELAIHLDVFSRCLYSSSLRPSKRARRISACR